MVWKKKSIVGEALLITDIKYDLNITVHQFLFVAPLMVCDQQMLMLVMDL
jgi:hypothetical protein